MSTIKTLLKDLFPKKNRAPAARAFVRTFWQTFKGISAVLMPLGLVSTAADVVAFDWIGLAIGAAVTTVSSLFAGLNAAGDMLINGVPPTYNRPQSGA